MMNMKKLGALCALVLCVACNNNPLGGGGEKPEPNKPKPQASNGSPDAGAEAKKAAAASRAEAKKQEFAAARSTCKATQAECSSRTANDKEACDKQCGDNATCLERSAAKAMRAEAACSIAASTCEDRVAMAEARYKAQILIADATKDCSVAGNCGKSKKSGGAKAKCKVIGAPETEQPEGDEGAAEPEEDGDTDSAQSDDADEGESFNCKRSLPNVPNPTRAECRAAALYHDAYAKAGDYGTQRAHDDE